jgi:zinc transport system ATP-binding protein
MSYKVLNKLYSFNLIYNIIIASIFAMIERIIKTVFTTNTIDRIMLSDEETVSIYTLLFLITVRYIFACNRHIYAYSAGYRGKYIIMQHYYTRWISNEYHINNVNYKMLLKNTCDRIIGLIARIATDFIPGFISIIVGCYNCLFLADLYTGIIGIVYVASVELLYYYMNSSYSTRENKLTTDELICVNDLFNKTSDTLDKRDTVYIYNKIHYEYNRIKTFCEDVYNTNLALVKAQNYSSCILIWLGHIINGGMVLIYRGRISSVNIIILLYNVSEIRAGISELKTYYKYYTVTSTLINTLESKVIKNDYVNLINRGKTIKLDNVSLTFGKKQIYRKTTYRFISGDYYVLIAPNGSGKSSLFKLLTGIYKPDAGIIYSPESKKILMCEQNPQIFTTESIMYNISYGCNQIIDGNDCITDSIKRAVSMLDLGSIMDLKITSLSGGERQKVNIARVLARAIELKSIDLLLLDEYDSALDQDSKETAFKAIEYIKSITNCTVIIITHNEESVKCKTYKKLSIANGKLYTL